VLAEHTDIEDVITDRRAGGVARANKHEWPDSTIETRTLVQSAAPSSAGCVGWTPRTGHQRRSLRRVLVDAPAVDSIIDPHRGYVLNVRVGAGLSRSASTTRSSTATAGTCAISNLAGTTS